MWRPDKLLMAGVGLAIGLTLAWAGAALTQDRAGKDHDLRCQKRLADLSRDIEGLRQDLKLLKQAQAKTRDPEGAAESQANPPDSSAARGQNLGAAAKEAPRGQITRIDPADLTLVEVNLGKDAGLTKHDNLEIVRGSTSLEHIGTLRIIEVHSQRAVCRLVSTNPLKKQVPQVGDQVGTSRER